LIAEVVLNSFSKATDKIYHYAVDESHKELVDIGVRVIVPFGRGNRMQEAFVIALTDQSSFENLKSIADVTDSYKYFGKKEVELAKFMVHRYFCSYISAIKVLLPTGLGTVFKKTLHLCESIPKEGLDYIEHSLRAEKVYEILKQGPMSYDKLTEELSYSGLGTLVGNMAKKGIITVTETTSETVSDTIRKRVCLLADSEEVSSAIDLMSQKAPARARCLEVLSDFRDISLAELLEIAHTSKSVVDSLVERGMAQIYENIEREDIIEIDYENLPPKNMLTPAQRKVADEVIRDIKDGEQSTFLLNGVTGSGKTEVYLDIIEKTVALGKKAIFLVPEISLTPQMVSRVTSWFDDRVAVIHSSLTRKQRFEQWKKIKEGEVDIVVGARSAVFAPFENIGVFIVDEEHENTYKSEFSPKYNAVEIAKFRANQNSSVVILASATPLVESMFKAQQGKYKLLELTSRVNNSSLPVTEIVDMRNEMTEGNMSIFSTRLIEEIASNLDRGEQTILFLNRRGFSSFVSCRSCGYVAKCPNCNVSLTYHKSIGKLVCHYCDYVHRSYTVCPECSSKYIKHFGIGTQRVAQEISELFPEARVIRMDADTTSQRSSHEKFLNSFKNHEADILVGTQMITKGLDFKNVTLVGIVAADMSLNVDDYRASERTFDLITQVVGRAGRGQLSGRAIIQTYNPDNETILTAANQDYDSFYTDEIELRKLLIYPPFCEFINFVFTSENKSICYRTACDFHNEIKSVLSPKDAILYKVSEAPIFRLNGKYRYRFLVKTRYSKENYELIAQIYAKYSGRKTSSLISIDVNPTNMY